MKKTYMVRWNSIGVPGFGSENAAQQFIDRICMAVAPDIKYVMEEEF